MGLTKKETKQESIPLVASETSEANHGSTDSSQELSPEHAPKSTHTHGNQEPDHPLHRQAFTKILIFQSLISVAFLAVRENIVFYCTKVLFYVDGGAPKMIEVYAAVVPCLPVFGGILADMVAGRFRMIKIGAFTLLIGLMLLTLNVIPFETWFERSISIEAKRSIFILGFTLMFLGFAGYGANVGPFAARQVEQAGEKAVRTLFHWFYWSTAFGLAIALPIADYVERAVSFGVGFAILTVVLIVGIVILMFLRSDYVEIPPKRDALTNVFKILFEAIKNRIKVVHGEMQINSKLAHPDSTLDYAGNEYGGRFSRLSVDEVKHLLKTLPAFHTVTIYAIVHYFITTSFREQFYRLNPYLGDIGDSVYIPNVSVELYATGVLLAATPILCYLYPWLQKKGVTVTPLRRIGIGIFFSLLSVLSAGLVEWRRKVVMEHDGGTFENTVNNVTYEASKLSSLTLIPQVTFASLAEAFIRVAGLELAYLEGPEHLKGLTTGLYILMSGVGSYILARILIVVINGLSHDSPWYLADINNGHMQYFYLVLAVVLLLDILYLALVSRKYEYAHWRERATREGLYPDVIPGSDPITSGYARVADSDTDGSVAPNVDSAPP